MRFFAAIKVEVKRDGHTRARPRNRSVHPYPTFAENELAKRMPTAIKEKIRKTAPIGMYDWSR